MLTVLLHRDRVLVATKVAGPSGQMTWLRGGPFKVDRDNITEAVEGSLRRLGTDYIDLVQIHWPDRYEATRVWGEVCVGGIVTLVVPVRIRDEVQDDVHVGREERSQSLVC